MHKRLFCPDQEYQDVKLLTLGLLPNSEFQNNLIMKYQSLWMNTHIMDKGTFRRSVLMDRRGIDGKCGKKYYLKN